MNLHARLRAFGLAPTPDPAESWLLLRPLLRDRPVTALRRVRRGPRVAVSVGVAVSLLTSVALAAGPMGQVLLQPWFDVWSELAPGPHRQVAAPPQADGHPGAREEAPTTRVAPAPEGVLGHPDAPGSTPSGSSGGTVVLAQDDTEHLLEDESVTIDVLNNDLDAAGATLQTLDPEHGDVSINPDRTVTYTPFPNFFGEDSFQYALDFGATTDWADVGVVVAPVNDPPKATDVAHSVDEDKTIMIDVLANAEDADQDKLGVQVEQQPAHGEVDTTEEGLVYRPEADFNGEDAFTYQVADGHGAKAVARVDIKVRPVNDGPTVGDIPSVDTVPGTPVNIDVLIHASDVDDDPLTVQGAHATAGSVEINPSGPLTYTPAPGFAGEDTIVFVISDGAGGTAEGKVTVRVVGPPPGLGDEGSAIPGPVEGAPGG